MRKSFSKCINIISILLVLLIQSCKKDKSNSLEGMGWVETKTFLQGAKANDQYAMLREKPAHQVKVDGFFIDITEVTNKQFKAFVNATGYLTIAERKIDWEEMKTQLPKGSP